MRRIGFALLFAIALYPIYANWEFYTAPQYDLPYMDGYEEYKTFRPSGFVGQGLGIVGSLMILIGVSSYMLRKRITFMETWGNLRDWLTFHILMCTLGPLLVVVHTTLKIGNVAAIAFWSMSVVVASGVFGRYVYIHIPKKQEGVFFSESDIHQQRQNILEAAMSLSGMNTLQLSALTDHFSQAKTDSIFKALFQTIRFDFQRRKLSKELTFALGRIGLVESKQAAVSALLTQRFALEHQQSVFTPFVKYFGYWHVFHVPLALVMLITLIVHIVVAVSLGYTWIF